MKTAINLSMVYTYFDIGRKIIEEEQNGKDRAEYGKFVLEELSRYLTGEFGKGFSTTNLKQMRKFYSIYAKETIGQTLSDQLKNLPVTVTGRKFCLGWSHYLKLMRIEKQEERLFYEIESYKNDWSLSELKRQFDSSLYERVLLSSEYSETELENRIIDNLQKFLLELGKGFTFVGRQVRFTYDEEHFFVDLVFYNRLLKCFVLFDLKIGEMKHQDIGQMQMYVNYYDRKVKLEDENPTIGIVLCKDKKESIVEMTLPENNNQIFVSKYSIVLPSKEELKKLLDK